MNQLYHIAGRRQRASRRFGRFVDSLPIGTVFIEDYEYDTGDNWRFFAKTEGRKLVEFFAVPFFDLSVYNRAPHQVDVNGISKQLRRFLSFAPRTRAKIVNAFFAPSKKGSIKEMTRADGLARKTFTALMSMEKSQIMKLARQPRSQRSSLLLLLADERKP